MRSPWMIRSILRSPGPKNSIWCSTPPGIYWSSCAKKTTVAAAATALNRTRKNHNSKEQWTALFDLDVFAQVMGCNVGGVDGTLVIRRNAGRCCPTGQAVRVRRIGNKRLERAVQSIAGHDASDLASLGCRVGESRAHIDGVVLAYEHRARFAELLPCGDEVAVLIEDLDALVPAIGDIAMVLRAAQKDVVGF